ncbi:MAG TPA: hypothetical protein VE912_02800 [Bacteroidales bacterium]|nr:hypothetical protein [Bacteroidales bacterium]
MAFLSGLFTGNGDTEYSPWSENDDNFGNVVVGAQTLSFEDWLKVGEMLMQAYVGSMSSHAGMAADAARYLGALNNNIESYDFTFASAYDRIDRYYQSFGGGADGGGKKLMPVVGSDYNKGMPTVIAGINTNSGKRYTLVVSKETKKYINILDPALNNRFNEIIISIPFGSSKFHPINFNIGRVGTEMLFFISNMIHPIPIKALNGQVPTTDEVKAIGDKYDNQHIYNMIYYYRKEGLIY